MAGYDGRTPIRYCGCGCGVVIGDGEWTRGTRSCTQLRAMYARATSRNGRLRWR